MTGHVATAEIDVSAAPAQVWAALTDPAQIRKYMLGSEVVTDWEPGSRIVWKGEFEGKRYEDHGEILEVVPARQLKVSHFSPLTGQDDVPENYHTVIYDLEDRGDKTHVSLTQDNNTSREEAARASANWQMMLDGLKEVVERG